LATFEILPAIDLRAGRVVRLVQGDFDQETAFGEDPAAVAAGFVEAGARWLHVVDLDGARAGEPRQLDVIAAVVRRTSGSGCRVEVGGGLRTVASVDAALGLGTTRIVLGTAALRDPALVAALVARHGSERVAVALDVRDGEVIGQGWSPDAVGAPLIAAFASLADAGARVFEATAVLRDGTMTGPDLALYEELVGAARATGAQVVASGGIRSIADLQALRDIGCAGAIVGRALFDGTLSIQAALGVGNEVGGE
jgi:phosphoribosylformimino-5-aminoimidazole carboxamide ribotide isomerase